MQIVSLLAALFSVLIPSKMWFAPDEPLAVRVDAPSEVRLVLTDFQGRLLATDVPAVVKPGSTVDLRELFPKTLPVGTYVLYAIPTEQYRPDEPTRGFIGTPLVIGLRADTRPGAAAGPMVIRVEPLCYAAIQTTAGPMTAALYYDSAPNTVSNFLHLAREGFYDGRTFHRVVPNFVIQSGDPLGDNSGGPGYTIGAEFNARRHTEGVLSMAREGDPMEAQGAMPRPEYADTAGSQFFICLNYEKTRRLDRKYAAFGQVVAGLEVLRAIGGGELVDSAAGRPKNPVTIQRIEIRPVTADSDPYPALLEQSTTAPALQPALP